MFKQYSMFSSMRSFFILTTILIVLEYNKNNNNNVNNVNDYIRTSGIIGIANAFAPILNSKKHYDIVVIPSHRFHRRRRILNSNLMMIHEDSMTSTTTTKTTKSSKKKDIIDSDDSKKHLRSKMAKETWSTVALQSTIENHRCTINLLDYDYDDTSTTSTSSSTKTKTKVYNPKLFMEFATSIKGTYFINGLSSCRIGDRLVHPFEAHGYIKSLVLDGKGNLEYNGNIVQTPLNSKERMQNRMLHRGVMSTITDNDSLWGSLQNAFSPTDRDTANLTADIWPPPHKKNNIKNNNDKNNNNNKLDPLLIVCTDNGEPYALDPSTLQTKGRLSEVVPKLSTLFPPNETKCLAHTRYDPHKNTFVMCKMNMLIPGQGQNFKGNVQLQFVEFDDNFDILSTTTHTTDRFMVLHDWALSQHYYVVPQNPAVLNWENIAKFTMGTTVGTDVFSMEEDCNSAFLLIPRPSPSNNNDDDFQNKTKNQKQNKHHHNPNVLKVPCDTFFNCFHFGPVFETKDTNELIINACVFDSYTFGGEMGFDGVTQQFDPIRWGSVPGDGLAPPPQLDQYVLNMKRTTHDRNHDNDMNDNDDVDDNHNNSFSPSIKSKTRVPVIPVDMPTFLSDATPCQYSYFLGASRPEGWFPFRQIVKLNLTTHQSFVYDAGDHQVVSEPMFLPRPTPSSSSSSTGADEQRDEDDGFVISIVHDARDHIAKLVIWDSPTFENGPIAECTLGDLIPWCVHGSFYPNYIP